MMGREMSVEFNSGTCLVNAGPRLEKKTSVSPRCDISTQTITTPLIHIDHLSASWFKRGRERESVKDRQRQWRYKKQYASHLLNTGWLSYSAFFSFFLSFFLFFMNFGCCLLLWIADLMSAEPVCLTLSPILFQAIFKLYLSHPTTPTLSHSSLIMPS